MSVLRRRFSIFVCVCGVRPQRFFLVSYSLIVSAFYVSSVLSTAVITSPGQEGAGRFVGHLKVLVHEYPHVLVYPHFTDKPFKILDIPFSRYFLPYLSSDR